MTYAPHFFSEDEFQGWWLKIPEPWFVRADAFRAAWGDLFTISGAPGAVGRHLGEESKSWHNIDYHGAVYAVDGYPKGIVIRADAERAIEIAKTVGFTGIGFYPHWSKPGFHFDIRTDRTPGNPALWGAIARYADDGSFLRQEYVSIERALSCLPYESD